MSSIHDLLMQQIRERDAHVLRVLSGPRPASEQPSDTDVRQPVDKASDEENDSQMRSNDTEAVTRRFAALLRRHRAAAAGSVAALAAEITFEVNQVMSSGAAFSLLIVVLVVYQACGADTYIRHSKLPRP